MVYMEPRVLGFAPLVASWLSSLPPIFKPPHKTLLEQMCLEFIPNGTQFLRRSCKEIVNTVDSNLCASCFRLIDSLVATYKPMEKDLGPDMDGLLIRLPAVFVFCFVWSVGITADGEAELGL